MARIDEVTIVWKADTTGLDKSRAAFQDVDKAMKQTEKSAEGTNAAITDVGRSTTKSAKEIDSANKGAATSQANLTTSITKTTAATTVLGGTTGKVFQGIKTQIMAIGPLLGAAFAIQQVASFASSILTLGSDFTSVMSRVQALTRATEEEFLVLEERAKELGATTQFSASQAAEAMVFLAQAGFNTKQIFDALPATLQLAAAGQLDLATAADIASNVLSGYGLQAEELGRVNDIIIATTSKANTNVMQFSEAFKTAAPIAKSAGIEIEEAASAIGTLANAGIQGSLGGTALRGVIAGLISPSNEAKKELDKLGVSATNADGSFRDLSGIFQDLQDAGVTTAQLFTIFGREAASAAAVFTQAGDGLGEFADVLGGSFGIAASIATEQMNNLKGDSLELESAIEGQMLTVFEALEGVLRFVTQAVTFLINNLGTLLKTVMVGVVGITAYTAATRGMSIAIGFTSNVLIAARKAITAFNLAMASSPVGLIAAGLAAAAAAAIVFRKELGLTADTSKGLTESQQQFIETLAKEEGQLKTLFDALKTANAGSEQRKTAIQEINKAYGQYLPNMLTEQSSAKEIEEAYKAINEQLIQKIALQAREQEITAANTKFIQTQREAFVGLSAVQISAVNDFVKLEQELANTKGFDAVVTNASKAEDEFQRFSAAASQAGIGYNQFREIIFAVIGANRDLDNSLESTSEFFSQYINKLNESISTTSTNVSEGSVNAVDALETLKKRIEELGKELLKQSLAGQINNATLKEYQALTQQLEQAQYRLKDALQETTDWWETQADIIADASVDNASSALDYYNILEAQAKEHYTVMLIAATGNADRQKELESELSLELLKIQKDRLGFELGLLTEGTLQYQNKRNEILEAERKIQNALTEITRQGVTDRDQVIRETDRQRDIANFERVQANAQKEIEIRKQVSDGTIQLAQELSGALQEITQRRVSFEENLIQQQLEKGIITEEQAAERRKQLQQEEAQRAKTFAVFDVLLKTAQAIMAALAQGNAVQAAFAAATGAIQLGVVASTPLPFAEGVIDLGGKNKGVDSVHALLAPGESVMTHKETQKYKPALIAMREGVFDKEYLPLRSVKPEFATNDRDGGAVLDTAEMEYLLNRVWKANEAGAEKIANAVTKSMKKQSKRYYI